MVSDQSATFEALDAPQCTMQCDDATNQITQAAKDTAYLNCRGLPAHNFQCHRDMYAGVFQWPRE